MAQTFFSTLSKTFQNTVVIVMMSSPHTHTFVPSLPLSPNPSDGCCPLWNVAGTVVGVDISQVTNTKCQEQQGGTTLKCVSLREGHGCNTADCDAHDALHLWGRWDAFKTEYDWYFKLSAIIWDMNIPVSPVYAIALLRKSTATDFLQKVREKRASECFPGGCSTEVSEAGEMIEVAVEYVSSRSIVLSFIF